MSLSPQTELDIHHVQAMVRAMYDLATTDGVHDTERVMLRGFYDACQGDARALTSYDELIGSRFDIATAAEIFDTPERRSALLQSCILLAYADGNYSAGERAKVKAFSDAVGVSAEVLKSLEDAVSDHLLQQISRIGNLDALKQVATELDKR